MNLKEIADKCTMIINSPEQEIHLVSELLKVKELQEVVFLSLATVFKNIIPLYKIRIHSKKVKNGREDLKIEGYDKELLACYNEYVKMICASRHGSSFRAACELLKNVDHFNFNDRVVAKVLNGTLANKEIADLCVETLVERILEDVNGESVYLILSGCLEYSCSKEIVKTMLESKYLKKCVERRICKELKYNKEKEEENKRKKKEEKRGIVARYRNGNKFFKKGEIYDKKIKKEEKSRIKQQDVVKKEENEITEKEEEERYVKTVNALQRVYFTILKEKKEMGCVEVFLGVRIYIKLIRQEFREGLYVLLTDRISECVGVERLEGMLTILDVYEKHGYDFKTVMNALCIALEPTEYVFGSTKIISEIVRKLFVVIRQPIHRVFYIMQKMIQLRCVRMVEGLYSIVKMLEVTYDIDFKDNDFVKRIVNASADIDQIVCKPFYEYFLLKKII